MTESKSERISQTRLMTLLVFVLTRGGNNRCGPWNIFLKPWKSTAFPFGTKSFWTWKTSHRCIPLTGSTWPLWPLLCKLETCGRLWTTARMFCNTTVVVLVSFMNEYEWRAFIISHLFLWASFIKVFTCNYFKQPNLLSDSRWASYLLTDESYFTATDCILLQAVNMLFFSFFLLRTKEAQTALADQVRWLKNGGEKKHLNSFSILPLLL